MSFDNDNDFYMRLKFARPTADGKYHTFLKQPIIIKPGEKLSVCLVDVFYQNVTQFINSRRFTWDLGCPRLTGLNPSPPPPPVLHHQRRSSSSRPRQLRPQSQPQRQQQQQQQRRFAKRKSLGGVIGEEKEEEEE